MNIKLIELNLHLSIGGKMIQQPTLPVQQNAVQQQYQQCPVQMMPQAPEFNAIKINITGANVSAPSAAQPVSQQTAPADNTQQPTVNYLA